MIKSKKTVIVILATLLKVNSFAQLKVMPSGYVGVGTTSSNNALDVVGNGAIFKSTHGFNPQSCAFIRGNSNYSNSSNPDYTFANDLSTGFSHPAAGKVEWNSNGFACLSLNGPGPNQLNIYGDGIAWQWDLHSDKRLKKDIKRINSALDKVMGLNGYSYEFDVTSFTKYTLTPGKRLGFIAQEVQEVLPELVSVDDDGYLSMNYDGMIPVLLEAIKELKKELELVKSQIKK